MKDTRHIYRDQFGLIASIRVNGKQRLKRVKTEQQAHEWFLLMETNSIPAASLTFKQLNDAASALSALKQAGLDMTLYEAVTNWLNAEQSPAELKKSGISFHDAIEKYLERSKSRITEGTWKDYKTMLLKAESILGGDTLVSSFKKPDAIRFLDRFLSKPPTWGSYQRTLSRFFTECVNMEWCKVNPFIGLTGPRCKPPSRQFLTVEDAQRALSSVSKRQPRLIHFLTLGLFAGIRPIESLRLKKEHFNFDTGYIYLSGDITKSHSYKERMVPINGTLKAWLEQYPFDEKPIPVNDICYVDKVIKDCSILDHWPRTQDNLRHTFATYRFALTNNSAETAAICGHSEAIAMKHYRGRVTKEEAERYFQLKP